MWREIALPLHLGPVTEHSLKHVRSSHSSNETGGCNKIRQPPCVAFDNPLLVRILLGLALPRLNDWSPNTTTVSSPLPPTGGGNRRLLQGRQQKPRLRAICFAARYVDHRRPWTYLGRPRPNCNIHHCSEFKNTKYSATSWVSLFNRKGTIGTGKVSSVRTLPRANCSIYQASPRDCRCKGHYGSGPAEHEGGTTPEGNPTREEPERIEAQLQRAGDRFRPPLPELQYGYAKSQHPDISLSGNRQWLVRTHGARKNMTASTSPRLPNAPLCPQAGRKQGRATHKAGGADESNQNDVFS